MGSCVSTQEFSREKSKKEHAFIKLGLSCDLCRDKCPWAKAFGERWMSVDEEYMRAHPQVFPAPQRNQGIVIGGLELRGSFCQWNNEGRNILKEYSEKAGLVQIWDRPSDKTGVGELRGLMKELTEANVEVCLGKVSASGG
ncbi:hypothetical protein NEUTE1DRAFT_103303 [Neurospora tetrasperma FGSC 2508]|uniref:Uncharacterized protein n=1 Tax=Neurospora tetrasperma (strain FGSC 2508 / ATCC MYA-4615 / P0657) TaxID=510951 RepID=F8MSH0_NEUT8|nr:uncharacterized protein NEUTE1DRAFT_103303 [Neurospora tetrasperma FGSC 2508]EGO55910.1 hypothetical protein NEUTE1DRAFT_103303 [Neurospora tetrasperma FGSC 2508]EGZ68834.1 hypothetical protein NEUTE2DRAFT_168514 [Neurospora tetrasperma FGSC 2509]